MIGEFLVLRRLRGGDVDLIATLYGTSGKVNLFVKEGYLNGNKFFGIFEPFNLVKIDFSQNGKLIIPNDILRVKRLSLFACDFKRFIYMSKISKLILRYITFYDEEIFYLILHNFIKDIRNVEVALLKFYLDFLKILGYEPKFLNIKNISGNFLKINLEKGEISKNGKYTVKASHLNILRKIYKMKDYERIRVGKKTFKEIEKFLNDYIQYHITK